MTKLLDCTTRDGGYCTNWDYSDEYIFNLMSEMNNKKICFYEIGYRNFYDREGKGDFYYCTRDLLKKFYEKKGDLKLGVMVDTKRFSEYDFTDVNQDCIDFVRIACHPDKIAETLTIAEKLNKKNYNIMIQLMDIKNLSKEHYSLLKNWNLKSILNVIYLADTYGTVKPKELEKIFKTIKDMGYKNIGFHAHNQTNLALLNSLKAIELGAYSIDITKDGGGINGGNLSYNEFFSRIH